MTLLSKQFKVGIFAILISLSYSARAAEVALANSPLVNSTTAEVLPNLMYILDNSGSMGWDFMPDYVVNNNKCKSTATNASFTANCQLGDPPRMTSQFNSIYYNPAITYAPPLFSTGLERPSMTSAETAGWTNVRTDPFNVQNSDQLGNGTNFVNLVPDLANTNVGYPDRIWCNSNYTGPTDLTNPSICKKNSQYIYPTNTGVGATSFNQPIAVRSHPYYYTVAPGEFCTDKELTNCTATTTVTGLYTFPATLRWCNSTARSDCQAKYNETTGYTHAKWAGYQVGSQASGTIKILAQSPANSPAASPSPLSITGITVDGVPIIVMPATGMTITDTTNSGQRGTLATNIRNAINAYTPAIGDDFVASSSGDTVTVTRGGAGAFSGTIDVTTTTHTTTAVPGALATGSINITRAGKTSGTSSSLSISNVKFGPSSVTITNGSISTPNGLTNANAILDLATKLKNSINAQVSNPDFTAACAGGTNCTSGFVTITAVTPGNPISGNFLVNPGSATGTPSATTNALQYAVTNMTGGILSVPAKTYTLPTQVVSFTGGATSVNTFNRIDIEPSTTAYPKVLSRTDCLGATTCTYAEEMTNFANWYSYYRTRMQMMKTSTTRAFKDIGTRYRVGFITIANQASGINYLPVNKFDAVQKASWYNSLVATNPTTATPLRTALSTVGQIFAGKRPVGNSDPVQYSCQQNFSILTTDGYWNGGVGAGVNNEAIADRDGAGIARPMFQGPTATAESLADVAKYYHDTDLRSTANNNCVGGPRPDGTTGDVCENNVFVTPTDNNTEQHMTTFTLGLGVDGVLTYQTDYQTAAQGDFYNLKQGTLDWPVPVPNAQAAVDDLWHAAVNGQGTYFSAKDPNQLTTSLNEALQSIGAKTGGGAAAATSNLSPVAGDNYAYVGSYTAQKWTGNLEARTVDTANGTVRPNAVWCVEDIVASTCTAPSLIVTNTSGGGISYSCTTPAANATLCDTGSSFDGTTLTCNKPFVPSCTGTLRNKVSALADSRSIFMNVGNSLGAFNLANINASGANTVTTGNPPYSTANFISMGLITPTQITPTIVQDLVKYLRGQTGFEDRPSNVVGSVDRRTFRLREATMGDPIDSAPVFIGAPKQNYGDPGYGPETTGGTFKNTHSSRVGTVYIGANDGMLHAFNSTTGEERWAYVPTMVIPNMVQLAKKDYSLNHKYFVNGDVTVQDVCVSSCGSASAQWKTVLVGGLNAGGKGYYALDITNPTVPQLLWEFDTSDDNDLGYSFGNPLMTKKSDGTWVVLLTAGHNNTTGTNKGKGVLYVLNASSGAVISKYTTSAGSQTTPSGLTKVSIFAESPRRDNTAKFVYGGDLLGNLWRFDINSPAGANNPFLVTTLTGPGGIAQPITTKPELTVVNGKRLIFVATGKYLESPDLVNTEKQTIYAITDSTNTTLTNPRSPGVLVEQTISASGGSGERTQSGRPSPVDYSVNRGWYVDLPDSGERVNVSPILVFGTLLVPSTVPSNTLCAPGGYGYLNFFDYKTGSSRLPSGVVSTKYNSPPVGMNVFYIDGKPVVSVVTSDNPNPEKNDQAGFEPKTGDAFKNHGVIWRELIEE